MITLLHNQKANWADKCQGQPSENTSTGTVLPPKGSTTFYCGSTSWDQIVQTHVTMRDISHPSHNSLHAFHFHLDLMENAFFSTYSMFAVMFILAIDE